MLLHRKNIGLVKALSQAASMGVDDLLVSSALLEVGQHVDIGSVEMRRELLEKSLAFRTRNGGLDRRS
jgi:hypothetical protein